MTTNLNESQIRSSLVETLQLDLVGPSNDHAFARELLPETPTRWYLTGFLVPTSAPLDQKFDESSVEEIDSGDSGGTDDDTLPDKPAAKRNYRASSMGLSVLVPKQTTELSAKIEWGEYVYEGPGGEGEGAAEPLSSVSVKEDPNSSVSNHSSDEKVRKRPCWRRVPLSRDVAIPLPKAGSQPAKIPVPNSGGLMLLVNVRNAESGGLAPGTKAVSVFLVNGRVPDELHSYRSFIFQVKVQLKCDHCFVPRPDPRNWTEQDEWDQRVNELHYSDCYEFAVGHGVSVRPLSVDGDRCSVVETTWLPQAEVKRVEPQDESQLPGLVLGMEDLAAMPSGEALKASLEPMVAHYRTWIEVQSKKYASLSPARFATAKDMLADAETAATRILAGIELLASDELVRDAFCTANRAMARAARQRFWVMGGKVNRPVDMSAPKWRPFQLAYILMTIRGIVEPKHQEREIVDLLFFPTGGGKTEAYLGLAAFTIVLRRLRNPGVRAAGMTVLMRYTLRLLTLDQLGRAAGLVCALELERKHPEGKRLGTLPFHIGLWVGQAATPNRMGGQGQKDPECRTAYCKTMRYKKNSKGNPSPIPIEECPWCGTKFTADSFCLAPNLKQPLDLWVHCTNEKCDFCGDQPLPIIGVDEPIYRRLPCFIIATVDKFAALPWTGETGMLFGKAERYDQFGFYGPCCKEGQPLPDGALPPPELIIQDELHLISGPLGTIAGLYETAIDSLASVISGNTRIRPKIVASTATVRRADTQINALFGRSSVRVFPPPGPDRRDSFFAQTVDSTASPARLYVGIAAQGTSLKRVLLRTSLAILSAGYNAWEMAGGKAVQPNPADPYMTLLGYFNSLRELGGSRRIVEDEVRTQLSEYGKRRRLDPVDSLFCDRHIDFEVLELTSRVSTSAVADAKRRLAIPAGADDDVDVALATNMISVGLDIVRLGLMVVLGQPKTSSEYIQATSRVGRDVKRPGLVLTLLNVHKPRDRSHYERFGVYHTSFYRSVEATSVTPFSPRALDRALAAALVALCRQGRPDMTPARGAAHIRNIRSELDKFALEFGERASEHNKNLSASEKDQLLQHVKDICERLLDDWLKIAQKAHQEGSAVQYQIEDSSPPRRLLYEFLHPEIPNLHDYQQKFRANRSMRDVEPSVEVFVKNLNDWEDK